MLKCENCNKQIKCKNCNYVIGSDGEGEYYDGKLDYCENCSKVVNNCYNCDHPTHHCPRDGCPCFVNKKKGNTYCCITCRDGKKCSLAHHWGEN